MDDDDFDDGETQLKRERLAKQRLAKAARDAGAAIAAHDTRHKERLNAIEACLAGAEVACIGARQHMPALHVERTPRASVFSVKCGDGNLRGLLRFVPDRTTGMVYVFADITVDDKTRDPERIVTVDPLDVDASTWIDAVATFLEMVANAQQPRDPARSPPKTRA